MAAGNYTVQQGDYLSKIAEAFGFADYQTIWFHPQNAELKQLRQNPNVLFPGDVIFIPDREDRVESRNTDKRHKVLKHGKVLKLRLTLEDLYEKPIANAQCILTVEGDAKKLTTDATGRIERIIPPNAHDATLVINGDQTPFASTQFAIKIGDLDPVDTPSGQAARLANLGYYFEDLETIDADAFSSAVEEFQCDHGLGVDGVCGSQTQAKLKTIHGC
jgi:hypothetical protein